MIFKNGQEMYETLKNADLYNEAEETYVFLYNEDGAVCTYNISKEEALGLEQKSREYGEYWSAFLGIGGSVYDEPMEFCDDHFHREWRTVS